MVRVPAIRSIVARSRCIASPSPISVVGVVRSGSARRGTVATWRSASVTASSSIGSVSTSSIPASSSALAWARSRDATTAITGGRPGASARPLASAAAAITASHSVVAR